MRLFPTQACLAKKDMPLHNQKWCICTFIVFAWHEVVPHKDWVGRQEKTKLESGCWRFICPTPRTPKQAILKRRPPTQVLQLSCIDSLSSLTKGSYFEADHAPRDPPSPVAPPPPPHSPRLLTILLIDSLQAPFPSGSNRKKQQMHPSQL